MSTNQDGVEEFDLEQREANELYAKRDRLAEQAKRDTKHDEREEESRIGTYPKPWTHEIGIPTGTDVNDQETIRTKDGGMSLVTYRMRVLGPDEQVDSDKLTGLNRYHFASIDARDGRSEADGDEAYTFATSQGQIQVSMDVVPIPSQPDVETEPSYLGVTWKSLLTENGVECSRRYDYVPPPSLENRSQTAIESQRSDAGPEDMTQRGAGTQIAESSIGDGTGERLTVAKRVSFNPTVSTIEPLSTEEMEGVDQ